MNMNIKESNIDKINRLYQEGKLDWADKERLIANELYKKYKNNLNKK